VVVFLVVIMILAGVLTIRHMSRELSRARNLFSHNMAALTSDLKRVIGPATFAPEAIVPSAAAIRGKIAVFEMAPWNITMTSSEVYRLLPSDLRASTPAEVGTVVWLQFELVECGRFADGDPVYREDCHVYVVDVAAQQLVARKTFQGGPAPRSRTYPTFGKTRGKVYKGTRVPDAVIRQYLQALPRK
jgi:hypothetical protein